MLLDIENVIKKAEYVGIADKHKDIEGLIHSHIFRTHVLDIDAYIIVWEYDSGDFVLHSISDAQDFMKYIKEI